MLKMNNMNKNSKLLKFMHKNKKVVDICKKSGMITKDSKFYAALCCLGEARKMNRQIEK